MLSIQRRNEIITLLSKNTFYGLNQLAQDLGVSISTARRDLDDLEQEGLVKRTHGGVMIVGERNTLPFFNDRQSVMSSEKTAIGKKAAELVEDGETIIIDGGTTPYQVALYLQQRKVQIITNSLPVANLFADSTNVQLISTGGTLYPGTGVYLGPYAESMLKNVRAQKAFIGVAGISPEGFYNSNALVVETEKRMLDAASEVYVVADHTKFGRRDLAFFCDFSAVTTIITNTSSAPTHLLQKDIEPKIKIIYV
ncbi:MAG: DeoR/GlpR family DNA-binding transcription regulator [Sedimentisphaerales bacterium]|nr:DeoR/GlpR family DNA-binding transcription regulator [Sedimentisphaerales bacterium]